jgi:hypothetical protein
MNRREVHVKFGSETWSEENPCCKESEGVGLTNPILTDSGRMKHLRDSFTHTYQKC